MPLRLRIYDSKNGRCWTNAARAWNRHLDLAHDVNYPKI